MRVFAQRTDTGKHVLTENVSRIVEVEDVAGIKSAAYYVGFQAVTERFKDKFMGFRLVNERQRKSFLA